VAQPVVHRWAIKHFHISVPLTGEKEEETERAQIPTHGSAGSCALPKTEVQWLQVIFNIITTTKKFMSSSTS